MRYAARVIAFLVIAALAITMLFIVQQVFYAWMVWVCFSAILFILYLIRFPIPWK